MKKNPATAYDIVAPFMAKRMETGRNLAVVHAKGNVIEATDAYCLARITGAVRENNAESFTYDGVNEVAAAAYPDIDQIMPTGEPLAKVRLNHDFLAKVAKASKAFKRKHGLPDITIEVYDGNRPVKFTATGSDIGEKLEMLVMPIR